MSEGQRFRTEGQSGLENGSASNVVVLVSSCDAYSDCWELFGKTFSAFWHDCPYPVRLITNLRTFDHPIIQALPVGPDQGWSANTRQVLRSLSTEFVLYMQEDYLLNAAVPTPFIRSCVQAMERGGFHYIKLETTSRPHPEHPCPIDPRLGFLAGSDYYRCSLQAALWRRSVFLELLDPNETNARFEIDGGIRSRVYGDTFLSLWPWRPDAASPQRVPGMRYVQGIARGRWTRSGAQYARSLEVPLDLDHRSVTSRLDTWVTASPLGRQRRRFYQSLRDPVGASRRAFSKIIRAGRSDQAGMESK